MKISELRKREGLSQAAFAEQIGTSQAYISQLEKGERLPSIKTLQTISQKFNVPSNELLDGLVPHKYV